MLELIVVLSWVLGKYSDLVIVSGLLVVNAIVSFAQERRASGVIDPCAAASRSLRVSCAAAPGN